MNTLRTLIVFVVCVCMAAFTGSGAVAQETKLTTAIQGLRSKTPLQAQERDSLIRVVIEEFKASDQTGWASVLELANDTQVPLGTRNTVLRSINDKLDLGTARGLLGQAARWASPATPGRSKSGVGLTFPVVIVVQMTDSAPWKSGVLGTDELLALTEAAIIGPPLPGSDYQERAIHLWGQSTAPAQAKALSAERISLALDRVPWIPDEVVKQLDAPTVARLRKVAQDAQHVAQFNWGAAAAISQWGDKAAASVLREKASSFASEDAGLAHEIGAMTLRIDAQSSHDSLLAAIHRTEPDYDPVFKAWLVRRASDLGVSKSELEKAVRAQLDKEVSERVPGKFRSRAMGAALREAALRVGLIRTDEYQEFSTDRSP